jgi:hypothetical protein
MPTNKTKFNARLYLKSRVTPRWRLEIKSAARSLFFSPYVTGKCAQRVLLVAGAGEVELCTVFTADNFAKGSSSLRCLRHLIEGGVKVFHLDGLHAKMLLVPGRAVTVGSQNLTTRGQGNLEATLLVTDKDIVKQAEAEAEAWVKERTPVTLQMIADMEKRVRPLRKLFKKAEEAAGEIDKEVRERQRERDEIARRERLDKAEQERQERERQERERVRHLQEQQRRKRLSHLHESVRKLRVASTIVSAKLQTPGSLLHGVLDFTASKSLMARENRSLTRWRFDSNLVTLMDCYRYLCLVEDTGKIGWARVASSRISFVAKSISHGESLFYRGMNWRVATTGKWKTLEATGCNLTVELKTFLGETAELDCWFSVDGLEVISSKWKTERREHLPDDFTELISKNDDKIRDKITEFLVEPFKYRDGQKLTGARAGGFFADVGRRFNIRLAKVGSHEVLLAKKVY